MPEIALLSQETIDKIAAGEVVERPSSVVKELVENALDAGAGAITIEIKEGGTGLIRITDNGAGILAEQVPLAFLRHSTSKIRRIEDLVGVHSLGFRGEALSSIAAVSRVELITKTKDAITGIRYVIEGGKEKEIQETGAPDGTTFLVRDLFYNTPVRRKFLKSPQTEANYIGDLVEHLALSHPEVSFKYINSDRTKLHTSGNGNSRDVIYHLYGRDITRALIPVDYTGVFFSMKGFLGDVSVTRGKRSLENYFINDRFIKSRVVTKAIEDAYHKFIMPHLYPFTALYFTFKGELLDVNVHPTKMELRFESEKEIYTEIFDAIGNILGKKEMIPEVVPSREKGGSRTPEPDQDNFLADIPHPADNRRLNQIRSAVAADSPYSRQYPDRKPQAGRDKAGFDPEKTSGHGRTGFDPAEAAPRRLGDQVCEDVTAYAAGAKEGKKKDEQARAKKLTDIPERYAKRLTERTADAAGEEMNREFPAIEDPEAARMVENRLMDIRQSLMGKKGIGEDVPFSPENARMPGSVSADKGQQYEEITLASLDPAFMSHEGKTGHRIIGQLFDTYWLVEYQDKLYIIDQHAAHEKVLYEQTMKKLKDKEFTSQMQSPSIILTLDETEISMLEKYRPQIESLGYVVEPFGGKEYQISGVPGNLYNLDMKDLFVEMLDDFSRISGKSTPAMITEKVASMSCKAAVKGNNRLSRPEIEALIDQLLVLDNPYNCPHGRPTMISMTKNEIEKSFKRIV